MNSGYVQSSAINTFLDPRQQHRRLTTRGWRDLQRCDIISNHSVYSVCRRRFNRSVSPGYSGSVFFLISCARMAVVWAYDAWPLYLWGH